MKPIDILITYCDEKELYPEFDTYMKKELIHGTQTLTNDQAFGKERTRNWDNLKYWFRGVEQNCPWVNKIFFVVANEKHIPAWLNTENPKLRIVFHREFIPAEFLPTYNIRVIEAFEHRIEDLSETFVYCDDDFFFLNPIRNDLFFDRDGSPQPQITTKPYVKPQPTNVFNINMANTQDFLVNFFKFKENVWFKISHLPEPRLKSWEKYIFDTYYKIFYDSLIVSRFRHPKNYLMILIYLNTLKNDLLKKGYVSHDIYKNSAFKNVNTRMNFRDYVNKDMACFNDSASATDFDTIKKRLLVFFEGKFPQKSSFER